jgi:hypothetical protein
METIGRIFKMRLIHYLHEDAHELDQSAETKKKIHKECKPFLRASKGYSLWRGMWNKGDKIGKYKVRKDRKPLDTPADVHKELDIIFKRHFGWPARSSGLLTTGDEKVAATYGYSYQIFPIGKFRFIWSEGVHDLYGKYVEFMTKAGLVYSGGGKWQKTDEWKNPSHVMKPSDLYLSDKKLQEYQVRVFAQLDTLIKKEYSDKNLDKAINSANEIMIDCKEYYALIKGYYV